MKTHAIFPVTVCEFNYPKANEFKNNLSKSIFKHLNDKGFSDELTGHVSIHHDPEYNDLFCFLQKCVTEYLTILNINSNNFEINFVKSWFNIIKNRNTPKHSHGDAHISITYYANVPENCIQSIKFDNYFERMEPFPGCMMWNNINNIWNPLNSYSWEFSPKQGNVFIFPSKLMHCTSGEPVKNPFDNGIKTIDDVYEHRICIASDVLLTYKNKKALPLGLQPIENWRTFN